MAVFSASMSQACSQDMCPPQFSLRSPLRLLVMAVVTANVKLILAPLQACGLELTYDQVADLQAYGQRLDDQVYDAVLVDEPAIAASLEPVVQLLQDSGQMIPCILVAEALEAEQAIELLKLGITDCVLKSRLLRLPTVLARSLHELQQHRQQEAALAQVHQLEQALRDCTQQLAQEKSSSEAASRAKGEFLATISHELRTPLTGILGFSDLLSKQLFGPLNEKQQQYIDSIATCGQHLLELINDLLDLSKIEAGKEELTLEPLLIDEICQACMSLVQERAQQRGLQLFTEVATDIVTCTADQRRLKQILFNLLSNAVKFTETGWVKLQVTQTQDEILFSVIDTGIGIAEEHQSLLFEPFQQIDSGLDRMYEGTGLGLALSRRLARLHGGDITLRSQLGHGSCFTVQLPLKGMANGADTTAEQCGGILLHHDR